MTGRRLLALVIVGGCILFFVLTFPSLRSVRYVYMCALSAALLGATFLLGFVLGLPGVSRFTEKVTKLAKRGKRAIGAAMSLSLMLVVFGFFLLGGEIDFVAHHRIELFWLVVFPSLLASPYLIGVTLSSFSGK